jgi:hypothetical protein
VDGLLRMENGILDYREVTPRCCFLPCNEKAEWIIVHGLTCDDVTESCTKHMGDLMTDAKEHRIYRIPK